jgi:hypothetical protein
MVPVSPGWNLRVTPNDAALFTQRLQGSFFLVPLELHAWNAEFTAALFADHEYLT